MPYRSSPPRWLWLLLSPTGACSGDETPIQGSDESTSSTSSTSGGPTSTGDPVATTGDPSDDTAGTSSDSSSDASTSSGTDESTTGEPAVPESIALRVHGYDAGNNRAWFRYLVEDGVADGPTQLHPPSDHNVEVALELPEHRLVFGTRGDADGDIWLGSLEDPLPTATTLDTAPVPATARVSYPEVIPGEEAVLFADDETATLYRVDFPAGVPSPPVVLAHDVDWDDLDRVVDPTGQWVLFTTIAGPNDVVRAPLVAPDPDAIDILSDLAPGENASVRGFTPDGTGVFMWLNSVNPPLHYVDLTAAVASPPTPVVAPLLAGVQANYILTTTVPDQAGIVFSSSADDGNGAVQWIGIADGEPQTPVTLRDGANPTGGGFVWSPDGSWLVFNTWDGAVSESEIVEIVDGVPGEPMSLAIATDELDDPKYAFMIDSEFVYLHSEQVGIGRELVRHSLAGGVLGPAEVVVPDGEYVFIVTAFETTLLFEGTSDEGAGLFSINVAGAVPGASTLVAPMPADAWVGSARFSPAGQFVAWEEYSDGFEYPRLMLVHRTAPREAVEVMNPMIGFAFASDW
jgi:hypothetical protein